MTTLATIGEILLGVLKFPKECLSLIRALQSLGPEQQQKLAEKINNEAIKMRETGRPTWD